MPKRSIAVEVGSGAVAASGRVEASAAALPALSVAPKLTRQVVYLAGSALKFLRQKT
jgi:hypothetical protein